LQGNFFPAYEFARKFQPARDWRLGEPAPVPRERPAARGRKNYNILEILAINYLRKSRTPGRIVNGQASGVLGGEITSISGQRL